jgi:hypothetical protein
MKNKKKKALAITWDDSDKSSSDEDSEQEEEHQANICFMANINDDQVSSNDELIDAFNELFSKFKQLSASYKILKNENDNLKSTIVSPFSSEIHDLKILNTELFSENDKLSNNNRILKSECDMLNNRISDLDLNICSLKSKYEVISENVGKFNKGKEDLKNLLSYQLPTKNRSGLGYSSNIASSTSNVKKKNHAFLYSRFVKSTNHASTKNIIKTDSMHAISHVKNSFKNVSQKSLFIWVPKDSCLVDRDSYIEDYKLNVCNSSNYLWKNRGKPNSFWVWFPKI